MRSLLAAVAALTMLVAGCGPLPFSDPGLTTGISVANRTDRALRFAVDAAGDRIGLPGPVGPGEDALIISGSAIGPDSRIVQNGCTVGPLVAVDGAGREVARHPGPLCLGDEWVVTDG